MTRSLLHARNLLTAVGFLTDAADPVRPTLARFADPDRHPGESKPIYGSGPCRIFHRRRRAEARTTPIFKPADTLTDAVACLLFEVTSRPYRELYQLAESWSAERRDEVIDVALRSRTRRDELLRSFRGGPYVYDIVMDIGAYRDMHRHRRCVQFRQEYGTQLGYSVPELATAAGCESQLRQALDTAFDAVVSLPGTSADYILPFATRARFLFKMDFAEAEYICRLRSGVKGHFSYRKIAWDMKCAMEKLEKSLGKLLSATPPWVEDPLKR